MPATIEVRFKGNRKDYYRWPDEAERLYRQVPVIVEAERGLDFGRVGVVGEQAEKKCAAGCGGCAVGGDTPAASRAVIRIATQDDIKNANDLRRSEEDTRHKAMERVRHHGLDMKLADAEWQWDKKKLTFYFTAEKRVDFRDLVRDLASAFKTRIELRQIGVRDEAARLGGVGRCGKEYCCSTWLRDLDPISLALAKDQHLSLNPAQISGGCGRLLCCLKYEHEFYVASRKRFPKEGKTIRTAVGAEKVIAVDIFRERVFLRSEEHGARFVLLADLTEEIARAGGPEAAPTGASPVSRDTSRGDPTGAERPRGDRPRGDRPRSERPRSERPGGEQPVSERPNSDRPRGDRPRSERPDSDRPRGDRPRSERPDSDRPRGERPRSEGSRGERPDSDRPRGERPARGQGGDRPAGEGPFGEEHRSEERRRDRQRVEPSRQEPSEPATAAPGEVTPVGSGAPESDARRRKRRRRRGKRGGDPTGGNPPPPTES